VTLTISPAAALLAVTNQLPAAAIATTASADGRGLRGMRQRVELLGGTIDTGATSDCWSVRVDIPLHDTGTAGSTTSSTP
jgi:glucose-6-phosphate-specific signal transduction histidine kinase